MKELLIVQLLPSPFSIAMYLGMAERYHDKNTADIVRRQMKRE